MKTTKALFSESVYDFQSERWNWSKSAMTAENQSRSTERRKMKKLTWEKFCILGGGEKLSREGHSYVVVLRGSGLAFDIRRQEDRGSLILHIVELLNF